MSTQLVSVFSERLYGDKSFATALEHDPFTTLRNEGFPDLATAAERDRDRIGELVDRLYADDEFRGRVEQDPIAELIGWGLPEAAIGPFLAVAGAPDDVIERAAADVEAHISARKPATVAAVAAVLGTFAFAQQASASVQPANGAGSGQSGGDGEHAGRATCTSGRAGQQTGTRDDPDQQAGAGQGSDQRMRRRPGTACSRKGRRPSVGSRRFSRGSSL